MLFPYFRSRFRTFTIQDLTLVNDLLHRCYLGDWFLLNLLAKNTTAYMYRRIVKRLAESLRDQRAVTKTATISLENIEVKNGV